MERDGRHVALDMYSSKNPNVMTPAMQGVILDVTAPRTAKLVAEFNGHRYEHTIADLLEGARAHFLRGWLSEAVQFERVGYFCPDTDSTPEHPVFNRTVTLKDSWAKINK